MFVLSFLFFGGETGQANRRLLLECSREIHECLG